MIPAWLILALASSATGASGQIYRCVGSEGKATWQDLPCVEARAEQRMPARADDAAASQVSLDQWLRGLRERPAAASRPAPAKESPSRPANAATRPLSAVARDPLARVDERLLAECSQRFLECSDSSDARMDACVSALPRCGGSVRTGCCPSRCVDRYLGLRSTGSARSHAVRTALLDELEGSCAIR